MIVDVPLVLLPFRFATRLPAWALGGKTRLLLAPRRVLLVGFGVVHIGVNVTHLVGNPGDLIAETGDSWTRRQTLE